MAALQSIRSHGKLLVGAIAVALLLFIIGDGIRGSESFMNQAKQQVGEVNGESMSIQEYQDLTKSLQNYYEIATQKSSFSEEELNQINDEAWQTYVQNKLIEDECNKLGIAVSEEEVANAIKNGYSQMLQIPYFMNQQTQRYDYAQVNQVLTSYKQAKEQGQVPDVLQKLYDYYIFAQKSLRSQLLMQKYQVLLSNLFLSNPVEAKLAFDSRNAQTDVLLAAVPFASIDDKDIQVSDDEIKAKYNEEKEKFVLDEETRDLKVIDFQVVASAEDRTAAEKEINEAAKALENAATAKAIKAVVRDNTSLINYTNVYKTKEAFTLPAISALLDSVAVGTTTKPVYDQASNTYYTLKLVDRVQKADSVCYRQIGVAGKDEAEANTKADSIMNALSAGASFKDLAKKYAQTGDSIWVTSAQFAQANLDDDNTTVVNTLYSTPAGQTVKVKLSNGSVLIVRIDQTKDVKTMYNAAAIVKSLDFSSETFNNEYNKLSSFVAKNNTIEKLEANAAKENYVVRPMENTRNSSHNIAGIRGTHEALRWAFDTAKEGDISDLYESTDRSHIIVVALNKINPKGYLPQDKVKDYLTDEIKRDKKAEKILATANDFATASKYKGAVVDTVKNITFSAPAFIGATTSSEPIVSALASKTAKGQVSKAVKGNGGVYAIKVIDKKQSAEKFDAKAEQATLSQQNFRNAVNNIIYTLYKKANVSDNRYKFM